MKTRVKLTLFSKTSKSNLDREFSPERKKKSRDSWEHTPRSQKWIWFLFGWSELGQLSMFSFGKQICLENSSSKRSEPIRQRDSQFETKSFGAAYLRNNIRKFVIKFIGQRLNAVGQKYRHFRSIFAKRKSFILDTFFSCTAKLKSWK